MKLDGRQLAALVAVLEEGSFEKAAVRLYLTQSAVSQRVRQLENQLGQALLVRSSPPTATPAGIKLLGYYQQASLLESELLGQLNWAGGRERQTLTIGINADSLSTWCFDALQAFIERHDLLLDLRVDDQDQTHRMLKNGEVIGCISALDQALPGCYCESLGSMTYRCVASPAFKQQYFPRGVNRAAFGRAPMVRFGAKDQLQTLYLQRYWKIEPHEPPSHQVPSSEAFVDFIKRGLAWGMVPDIQARDPLATGVLTELTPRKTICVALYWHVWNLKSPLVRELSQTICAAGRRLLS